MTRQIILDTDIGGDVDDALALAVGLKSTEINLCLVTTVFTDTILRACIAHKVARICGCTDLQVAAGCNLPLMQRFVPGLAGHEGKDLLEPDDPPFTGSEHAVDALVRTIMSADQPLTLVTIGALTNIAAALIVEPRIAERVEHICITGGHITQAQLLGRLMPWSTDFNLIIDSEAARIVLQAPWQQITLVPVETTLQVWFDDDDRAALRAAGTPLTSALSIQIDHWLDYLHTKAGEPGSWEYETERAYLHDPLALAAVFEPRFLTFTPMHIRVEIQDGLLRTLAVDGQLPNMLVATAVDAPGFRQWMLERLTRP